MLKFNNQKSKLFIYKDGDKIFGELSVNDKILNREDEGFLINLNENENKTLDCILDGKKLFCGGKLIKEYKNVFKEGLILDLKIENKVGKIFFTDICVEQLSCELKRKTYKVNVTNDNQYTIVRYANLHQHTENSLLDGIVKIPELAKKTEYACAITDHGNMFGWYDMLTNFDKVGKKAIIGEEFYIETLGGPRLIIPKNNRTIEVEELMFDNSKEQQEEGLNREHLIVLAKNNQGIKNLFWLSSNAANHFYKKPHITFEELKEHKEGLIVASACIASGLNQFIKEYLKAKEYPSVKEWIENYGEFFYENGLYSETCESESPPVEVEVYAYNHKKARDWINFFVTEFKDDFYLEYQDHHFPLEKTIMEEMVRIRDEEFPEVKIIATCDAHYLNKEDAFVHELFLCNQTQKKIDDPKHMKFSGDGYYVHTSKEMLELFPEEYLDNTLEIEEKVKYEPLEKGYHLPHYPLPEGFENDADYFKYLCEKGFEEKFPNLDKETRHLYKKRLAEEGRTIKQMGWPSYFLIVQDFIRWAEDSNVEAHWKDYFPNKEYDEIPKELLKDYPIYVGSGRGCVNAGTLIHTSKGVKPIEKIREGEEVWTHLGRLRKVVKTYKYEINEPLYKIVTEENPPGNAYTHDHLIYVKKNNEMTWIRAGDVRAGDLVALPIQVMGVQSNEKYLYKSVLKIETINNEKFVYDIQVEEDHSYVTSAFIAHNSGAGSLINYCLGITKVDPIVYDLKFER